MNDPKPTKHWDSLAEELGAAPPPEPTAQDSLTPAGAPSDSDNPDQSSDASTPTLSRPKRERPPRKPPKPTPQHWSALAGELGLEVPPEPAPAASDADETASESDIEPGAAAGQATAETEPWAASEPGTWDATPEVEELASRSQTARREASLDVGFGIIAADDTRDPSFIEEAEDAVSEEDDDDRDEEADDEGGDSRPEDDSTTSIALYTESMSAAGNADADADTFDDLDEMPVSEVDDIAPSEPEGAAPDAEEKGRRRRRRRGGRRRRRPDDAPREVGEGEPESQATGESDDAEEVAEDVTDAVDAPTTDGRATRGRSRRGRRRRSGRASTEEQRQSSTEGGETPTENDEESAVVDGRELAEDTDVADDQTGRETRGRKGQDEPDAEAGDDLEGGRPSHRKIPSWQEAIGLIVTGNMEGRSRSGEDRPRGRGRGKGRRPNRGKKT